MANQYDKYVAAVRSNWGRMTPYRLGMTIGVAGDSLSSPYRRGTQGDIQFNAGVQFGKSQRAKRLQERAQQESGSHD